MCAIVGCYLEHPTEQQIETLKQLFIESQIRGKHAAGFSVLTNNKPWSFISANPAEVMVEKFSWNTISHLKKLALIGHCRYSTSDLRYNQPLQTDSISIVHNGVISQDPPECWDRYGYDLETTNDSEILLRAVVAKKEPLLEFPDASIAAMELHEGGTIRWYRNGKRPLYMVKENNGYFICSTADIARRVGLKRPKKCKPGVVYTPTSSTTIVKTPELIP